MKQNRKIAFLEKQIEEYKAQVNELKKENKTLSKENQFFRDVISSNQENFEIMQEQIIQAKEAQQAYISARNSLLTIKKQYCTEMEKQLERLKRQR